VREDLPYGYVPRIALAKLLGVCTPVTVAVTTLLGVYLDINPQEEGVDVDEEDLGLAGFSAEEIKKYVNTGEIAK